MAPSSSNAAKILAVVFVSQLAAFASQKSGGEGFLADAISDGVAREVHPYELRASADAKTVVGVIYTPYVRIARFARASHLKGVPLTPDKIPEDVSAPVLYVAMRKGREFPPVADRPTWVAAIMRPPTALPPGKAAYFVPVPRRLIKALRVEDVAAAESVLGPIPLDDVAAVGVFAMSFAEQSILEFCAYREYESSTDGTPAYSVVAGFVAGPLR